MHTEAERSGTRRSGGERLKSDDPQQCHQAWDKWHRMMTLEIRPLLSVSSSSCTIVRISNAWAVDIASSIQCLLWGWAAALKLLWHTPSNSSDKDNRMKSVLRSWSEELIRTGVNNRKHFSGTSCISGLLMWIRACTACTAQNKTGIFEMDKRFRVVNLL